MTDYTETGVSQLIINKIKKSVFDTQTKETNQMYLVNPEYSGDKVALTAADGNITESSVTNTEVGYLSGVTSAIQTQLNGKATTEQGAKADSALQQSDIVDNVTSTATDKVLSANQGKELSDRIDNISTIGKYLSQWNCISGLATTNPTTSPYTYRSGDYFIVAYVSTDTSVPNYKPNGTSYTIGVASTTVETETVGVGDTYFYDGTTWKLQINTQRKVTIANVDGLQTALDNKVAKNDSITASTTAKLVTYDAKGLVTGGSSLQGSDVTTALGYTPYNSTNPSGYTSNVGTITGVTLNGSTISSGTANLGNLVVANSAITASTTKQLVTYDTKGLVTGGSTLSSSDVTTALGYTPYNSTNPSGYISGITSNMVTTALGYTPYNSTNPNGYITSSYHDSTKQDTLPSGTTGYYLQKTSSGVQWAEVKSAPDTDGKSITTSSSSQLQTVGVINSRDSSTAIKTWTGTKAQYDAITTKDTNTLYNITDDSDTSLTILQTIYPVGSIYITTNAVCPLAALFGTWETVGTKILTDNPSDVPVKGNGMSLGLTNGTTYGGFKNQSGSYSVVPFENAYGVSVSTDVTTGTQVNGTLGVTTDSSKSGIVADLSSVSTLTVNIFRRTA